MLTKLFCHYLALNGPEKRDLRNCIMQQSGCGVTTFYRYLHAQAPPLVQDLFSKQTEIPKEDLYKSIN